MESQNTSFSSLFNYQNINLANTVSSLRVGKTTNGSNVRIITPISISGPISIYGADVITDADVTISGGGALFQASDVLLFGSSATNVSIATGPGSITLRSDLIAFDGSESSPKWTDHPRLPVSSKSSHIMLISDPNFSEAPMVRPEAF